MSEDLFRAEYDELPEAVKQYYSYHEYQWMSEQQRVDIIQNCTEPDIEEP